MIWSTTSVLLKSHRISSLNQPRQRNYVYLHYNKEKHYVYIFLFARGLQELNLSPANPYLQQMQTHRLDFEFRGFNKNQKISACQDIMNHN